MKQHPEKNIPSTDGIGERLREDGRRIKCKPSASLRERTLSAITRVDSVCKSSSNPSDSYLLPRIRIALGAAAILTVGFASVLLFTGKATISDDASKVATKSASSDAGNFMNILFEIPFPREESLIEQTLVKEFNTYTVAGRALFDDALAHLPQSIREHPKKDM